jgi:predicted membrane protein
MDNSNDNYDDWREDRRRKWEERRARRTARFTHGGVYAGRGNSHNHEVMGFIVLLLGILFLLGNLGYFHVAQIWQYWPVILIGVGIARIFDARGIHSVLWGATVAGVGVIFLANNMGYLPWYLWGTLWPVLLIFWGLVILLGSFGRRGHRIVPIDDASTISDNVLKEEVVFGGTHRKIDAQDFQGGKAAALFGGIEIDLRGASTTRDEIEIRADAVFGGVELKVPDTWDVTMRGSGVLGAYEDRTYPAPVSDSVKRPRLIIRGGAVFGGVTVRN